MAPFAVPLFDLPAAQEALGPALDRVWARLRDAPAHTLGPEVAAFEAAFARACAARHAIGVACGLDALTLIPMVSIAPCPPGARRLQRRVIDAIHQGMTTLTLDGIAKSYGRRRVLADVSVAVPAGLTLLTGPSGAGKSTLLRLVATAERPSAGTIRWNDVPLPAARSALRRTLGYAPQAVDLPDDLTAREFALHIAALKGLNQRAADAQFGAITEAIGLHPDINNRISSFSGGMRRRLVFAQALLGAPALLALDEPTAELDHETARRVGALILERARTAVVIMTTHLADELAPAARAVLRVDGGAVRAA